MKVVTSQSKVDPNIFPVRERLYNLFRDRPMQDEELLVNLGLYIRSGALAKILFLNEVYEKIINIPGIVCEFGIWWGQSLVLFENLRAVYEPYNYTRRVIGFDTFEGYTTLSKNDRGSEFIEDGAYTVTQKYEDYLAELLAYHEAENVMSHKKKHHLVKGDATITVPKYFEDNPESIVSLAFFDMALYEPTKVALEAIKPRLVKGSILVFDELNNHEYPGETKAFFEIFGKENYKLYRSKYLPDISYLIIE